MHCLRLLAKSRAGAGRTRPASPTEALHTRRAHSTTCRTQNAKASRGSMFAMGELISWLTALSGKERWIVKLHLLGTVFELQQAMKIFQRLHALKYYSALLLFHPSIHLLSTYIISLLLFTHNC
uniref:Uncharacterized protein n=1 Tax=Paramormyrops kingsleyae TaxID=1676925 RepID=A0A3B3SS80_9TELE